MKDTKRFELTSEEQYRHYNDSGLMLDGHWMIDSLLQAQVSKVLSMLEPVELEALGEEERLVLAKKVFGSRDGIRPLMPSRGDLIQIYSEKITQATICYNQSHGQLYRIKEAD